MSDSTLDFSPLANAVEARDRATIPTSPKKVKLGDGSYTQNVIDSDNHLSGAVNWHVLGVDSSDDPVVLEKGFAVVTKGLWHLYANTATNDGIDVWINKQPGDAYYSVDKTDAASEGAQFGNKPLGAQALDAAGAPTLTQVSTLRMTLSENDLTITVGDPSEVFVYPAAVTLDQTQFTVATIDVSDTQAALTSGQHQAIGVYLDTSTNDLAILTTTAVSASAPLPARTELGDTDFATLDQLNNPTYIPVGVVYLYYGQTEFDNTPITGDRLVQEVRPAFPPVSAWYAIKHKWDGTAAPTTGDDSADGYSLSSVWYDLTNDQIYVCTDASVGSALWKKITVTSSAGGAPADATYVTISAESGLTAETTLATALASPPAIGGGTPAAGTFSALTVNNSITQIIATKSVIISHSATDTRNISWPDASGTVALTSDITTATALAAILAPANTARNTIEAATTTIVPLTIKTTDDDTTNPAFRVVASDGTTVKASIGATGHLGVGTAAVALNTLTITETISQPANGASGLRVTPTFNHTAGSTVSELGMIIDSRHSSGGFTHVGNMRSQQIILTSTGTGGSYGLAEVGSWSFSSTGTASIGQLNMFRIAAPTNAGGATITTVRGIEVENISIGTTRIAIRTGEGQVTLLGSNTIASAASATWNGIEERAATATITGSTNITTATGFNYHSIAQPTLSAASALTITNAATLYIANAPTGGGAGPATITNAYALWVDAGTSRLDGALINGVASPSTTFTYLEFSQSSTDTSGTKHLARLIGTIAPSGTSTAVHTGLFSSMATSSGLAVAGGTVRGLYFEGLLNGTSGGSLTLAEGAFVNVAAATLPTITTINGIRILNSFSGSGTITTSRHLYIDTPTKSGGGTITNLYGIYIENISVGNTLNYAIYTNAGLVHLGDSLDLASGKSITLVAGNIITDTSTGTKIGTATNQKLSLWNATPNVQPTTAITPATFVANTSGIADDSATWDGYTAGQIVAALRRIGALA